MATRLPRCLKGDVLLIIFVAVADVSGQDEVALNLLRLAYTYSQWGKIMLAYGEPWSKLPSWHFMRAHTKLTDFLIERSKEVPLSLPCNDSTNPQESETRFIQIHLSRFCNLNIHVLSYDMAVKCRQVKFLENLKASEMEMRSCTLNFEPGATKLSSLSLRWCHLQYIRANYQNLVSLHLVLLSVRRRFQGERSILTAVTSSRNLEDLYISVRDPEGHRIEDWDPELDGPMIPLRPRYELKHLSHLELEMMLPHMLLVLGSITLPNLNTLESVTLSPSRLLAARRQYFKIPDVLSPDYLPPALLDNLHTWSIENHWRILRQGSNSETQAELNVSMSGVGHHYEVRIKLPNVEDIALDATDLSKHVKLSSLRRLTSSVVSLDLWIDISEAVYLGGSHPLLYGCLGATPLDPKDYQNLEELEVCFTEGWTPNAFGELATFCKRLPRLQRLAVTSEHYTNCYDYGYYNAVVGAVTRLGRPCEMDVSELLLGICVRGPLVRLGRDAADVDLTLFLRNDESHDYLEPLLSDVRFLRS
ncbi:hypothetical protein NM688_g1640 [Phlebia brevispora]|uniref:Uncharacterized protein n=1 Tax=Phlebia brevispora TaxID=194682 RepID=A0ACC1TAX7_9APHY|nr:hypothetical protein NM688_g1640 [Phlebia brevispora]